MLFREMTLRFQKRQRGTVTDSFFLTLILHNIIYLSFSDWPPPPSLPALRRCMPSLQYSIVCWFIDSFTASRTFFLKEEGVRQQHIHQAADWASVIELISGVS